MADEEQKAQGCFEEEKPSEEHLRTPLRGTLDGLKHLRELATQLRFDGVQPANSGPAVADVSKEDVAQSDRQKEPGRQRNFSGGAVEATVVAQRHDALLRRSDRNGQLPNDLVGVANILRQRGVNLEVSGIAHGGADTIARCAAKLQRQRDPRALRRQGDDPTRADSSCHPFGDTNAGCALPFRSPASDPSCHRIGDTMTARRRRDLNWSHSGRVGSGGGSGEADYPRRSGRRATICMTAAKPV